MLHETKNLNTERSRTLHLELSERKIALRIIDLIVVLSMIILLSILFQESYFNDLIRQSDSFLTFILYFTFLTVVFDMYDLHISRSNELILRSIFLTTIALTFFYLLTPFITPEIPENRLQILYFFASIFLPLLVWRSIYIRFFANGHKFSKKSLLIHNGGDIHSLINAFHAEISHYKILGYINLENSNQPFLTSNNGSFQLKNVQTLENFIRKEGIYEIIIGPKVPTTFLKPYLLEVLKNGILVKDYCQAIETYGKKIPIDLVDDDFYRNFLFSRNNYNKLYLMGVRIGEVSFVIFGLIFAAFFIFPFVFIGNLFGNKGKLFYTQERVGKYNRVFKIIKFRTMVKDAEKEGAVFAQKNDARITRFGSLLRKCRIDEIPQLINILKGDMALIGPRPERPAFVDQITEKTPLYPIRHVIKPGLTGWAQIRFSYGACLDDSVEKLSYDLYYIKNRSLTLDLRIMIKTISTIVFFRGQ